MKRTKLKSPNSLSSKTKNRGTQTENFDSLIEVAKLEEQVRVLQLENNVLRKHAEGFNKFDVHYKHFSPQAISKINIEKSSCGCKGNCSSRICGCVKKSNKCSPLCKCDEKMCQNQKSEYSQENKENVNRTDVETSKKQEVRNKTKNETVEKTKNNKGLFSPNVKELYKELDEGLFTDIEFSFKDTIIRDLPTSTDNIDNVKLKKKRKQKKEENDKEQQKLTEKELFDPMKPRHQLSRTPPNSKKFEKPPEVEHNVIQPQSHFELAEEVRIISLKIQDVNEEKVDWEEHTAQLVPCKKCKRTFLPNRIQKHEACCKKI